MELKPGEKDRADLYEGFQESRDILDNPEEKYGKRYYQSWWDKVIRAYPKPPRRYQYCYTILKKTRYRIPLYAGGLISLVVQATVRQADCGQQTFALTYFVMLHNLCVATMTEVASICVVCMGYWWGTVRLYPRRWLHPWQWGMSQQRRRRSRKPVRLLTENP